MEVTSVVVGVLGAVAAAAGFLTPRLRDVEQLLPDAALSGAAYMTAR